MKVNDLESDYPNGSVCEMRTLDVEVSALTVVPLTQEPVSAPLVSSNRVRRLPPSPATPNPVEAHRRASGRPHLLSDYDFRKKPSGYVWNGGAGLSFQSGSTFSVTNATTMIIASTTHMGALTDELFMFLLRKKL
jgi:hypothetical protein